ncbi:MAG: KilA-N domain-containing protein [Campylobacterota bacterium]|nr:KilA-N domain-containing protein [Campylobacterota bacterium]
MRELTKVFNNIDIPVEVLDANNIWLDVSNINRVLKVKFSEWKNSKRTKETLRLIEKSISIKRNLIDDEIYGKNFIHKKLFISFARFVSLEFEIKADEIIFDILTGSKQLEHKRVLELESNIKARDYQLLEAQKELKEAKRKIYAYPTNSNIETVTRIISDFGINITAKDLNMLLVKNSLIDVEIVDSYKFTSATMRGNTPLVHIDEVLDIIDKNNIERDVSLDSRTKSLFN